MITKGTTVRITTTNGGETVAILKENYRSTYDAVIASGNSWAIIPAYRIETIAEEKL